MSLAEAITDGLGGLHGPLSPRTLLTRGFAPFWQVYVVGLVQITSPWMYPSDAIYTRTRGISFLPRKTLLVYRVVAVSANFFPYSP